MEIQLILAFCVASLALAFMPGPDNMYVLTESLSKGWRQGLSITTGLISGVIIHTTLVATGLSLFVFNYPTVFNILKFAGAAYLLYIAFGAWKEKPMVIESETHAPKDPFWPLFQKGFVMNVLNPKVTLFFMVLLPQFVSHKQGMVDPFWQLMTLGGLFMAVSFPVFASIALVAGKISSLVASDQFWKITKWIKVIVLICLSVLLMFSNI